MLWDGSYLQFVNDQEEDRFYDSINNEEIISQDESSTGKQGSESNLDVKIEETL